MMRTQRVEVADRPGLGVHRAQPDRLPVAGRREGFAVGREGQGLDRAGELAKDQLPHVQVGLPILPAPDIDLAVAVAGGDLVAAGPDRRAGDVLGVRIDGTVAVGVLSSPWLRPGPRAWLRESRPQSEDDVRRMRSSGSGPGPRSG